jgi:hypothetical protein
MATGESLSPRGAQVNDIARAERERLAVRPEQQPSVVVEIDDPALHRPVPRQVDPHVLAQRRAAVAVLVHEEVRVRGEVAQRGAQGAEHVAEQGRPVDRPAGQGQRGRAGHGQLVCGLVDVDPDPDHRQGRRGGHPFHEDPADLLAVDQHVVRPLHRGEAAQRPSHGVPRHEGDHRPPLEGHAGVEDGREGQRGAGRRHPLAVQPAAPRQLVVGHHDQVAHGLGRGESVGGAGLGVEPHRPLGAGHGLECGLVER